MHSYTWVRGKTVSMASGKPFNPSTQARKMSLMPRCLSSVMTPSQNFAPSLSEAHSPMTSFNPERVNPHRQINGLVRDSPFGFDFHLQGIKIKNRIDLIQRARLPGADLINDCIGDR